MVTGKLPNHLLEDIVFKHIKYKNKDVITGAEVGQDNALLDIDDEIVVLSTDPITGAANDIGSLSINISCNDIAASGGKPVGILLTILAPPKTSHKEIETIMKDAGEAAEELKVEIVGGHTEITDVVNKIVVSTTAIGRLKKSNLPKIEDIKPGDKIVMTKLAGIEGTSIILNDLESYFKDKLDDDTIEKGKKYGEDISVLKEGQIGGKIGINYMHDITEGGVLGAVWEAHKAVGKGVKINKELIPISPITKEISEILDIDPLRLISSGSMLMILSKEQLKVLENKLNFEEIPVTVIGEIIEEGIYMEDNGELNIIEPPEADELYKALNKSKNY